jgi:hypothetical protein
MSRTTEIEVMMHRAGRLAKEVEKAADEAKWLRAQFADLLEHHGRAIALLSEAAQVDGALSVDLLERMAAEVDA